MTSNANFLVIGNPENRRVALFQQALSSLDLQPAKVIGWNSVLSREENPANHIDRNTIVRIESPGENFLTERQMIALGEKQNQGQRGLKITSSKAMNLQEEYGRIYYPRQWFHGFCEILKTIRLNIEEAMESFGNRSQSLWMNHPDEIATMFDKRLCSKIFHDNQIPIPESLNPIDSYEALRETMAVTGIRQVFVKLNCSSSASGVIAYRYHPHKRGEFAYTTVEPVMESGELKLFNSLKVRKYKDSKTIKSIIDWICNEGAHVERWIPKSKYQGNNFDLRIVVILGKACQRVVRMSQSPMTNLHLGNQRGDWDALSLSKVTLQEIETIAKKVGGIFPESLYAGIDVLIPTGKQSPVLLEANAFGDLLPRIIHRGMDTYQSEILASLGKLSF